MNKTNPSVTAEEHDAIQRLISIASRDTGQSKRVADFLLAWHNATENGGWNPVDLWAFDDQIKKDVLTVVTLIAGNRAYLEDYGFKKEIRSVWDLWRGNKNTN